LALKGVALALAWPWGCVDGLGLECSGLGLGLVLSGLVNIPDFGLLVEILFHDLQYPFHAVEKCLRLVHFLFCNKHFLKSKPRKIGPQQIPIKLFINEKHEYVLNIFYESLLHVLSKR